MHKRIKSIFLCLPFVCGSFCFYFGIFNLFSSLLFFVGGYVALKHFFNYKRICRRMHLSIRSECINGMDTEMNISNSNQQSKDKKCSYQGENGAIHTETHGKLEENCVIQVENPFELGVDRNDVKVRKRMKR